MKRGMTRPMNLSERTALFWSRVDRSGTGCWLWTGSLTNTGRGSMKWTDGRTHLAYRISWQLAHGPIPAGLLVCHKCDNGLCVRVDHLFLGTDADNVVDMCSKGRWVEPPHHRGEKHPRAVVPDAVVREVRERCAAGESAGAVARELGIARGTVGTWLSGAVRADAGGPILGGVA